MDNILRPPTPSSDTKAMTSVEEKGLYMPCPLHAALRPPPLPVFLEQFGGEFLHTEPLRWGQQPASGTCICGQLGEEVRSVLLGEALILD